MSISIRNMFSSPVATAFLDLDNNALEKFCREKCSNSEKYLERGFTQSDNLDLKDPALAELMQAIQYRMDIVHSDLGLSNEYQSVIHEAWANVDNNWSIRVPHSHPSATFACVYYVKGNSESGSIEFINPNLAHPRTIFPEMIGRHNEFTGSNFYIGPVSGKLIIFPAWLYHYVNSGKGNDERISIAFNVRTNKKEIK